MYNKAIKYNHENPVYYKYIYPFLFHYKQLLLQKIQIKLMMHQNILNQLFRKIQKNHIFQSQKSNLLKKNQNYFNKPLNTLIILLVLMLKIQIIIIMKRICDQMMSKFMFIAQQKR
ncbi:unnamed protein product [Paramecium pentaurelia]|uniref:Transmembrane protein n=1 Tax=Paramecium pentaurelia TaxID=43138 RepID=A0A8S1WI07_9CILI|nr:unnamed protein product [Paramecium pentaurelia]